MAGFFITNRPASRKYSILARVCFSAEWCRAYNGGHPFWSSMNMQTSPNCVRFVPKYRAFSTKMPCI